MARVAVILPAAGRSSRFGGPEKKPFALLAGRPVWVRTAERFVRRADVCRCFVVVAPEDRERFQSRFASEIAALGVELAGGGAERGESVRNALALVPPDADLVAIHDAARPCVSTGLIDQVFARAAETGAALLALPVTDTVKRGDAEGRVRETIPRQRLWLAQTPQVFRRDWLAAAIATHDPQAPALTDDAQWLEAAGREVFLVPGSALNLKITTPEDLALAEAILPTVR